MTTKSIKAPLAEFNKLKVGECLSEAQMYVVVKVKGNDVQLLNDQGEDIIVDKGYVESCLTSASQYSNEKIINKTDAAALLLANPNIALTVNYNTKVQEKEVVEEIMNTYKTSTPSKIEAALTLSIKKALEGTPRLIHGRHFGELNGLGRLNFIDMDVKRDRTKGYDNRIRQVDPRSIIYLIVSGTKYIVK